MNIIKNKSVLINEWHYFQPAGDSGVNNKNGGNSNGNRINGTSDFQRPILSCLNETKDQHQQSRQPYLNHKQCQHKQSQSHGYNVNQMLQPENQQPQQHQVIYPVFFKKKSKFNGTILFIDNSFTYMVSWNK